MAVCVIEWQNSLCYVVRAIYISMETILIVFYVFYILFSLEFQILYFIVC
jgi:hypothetical protein